MELFDLEHGMKFLAGHGHVLNVHEITSLQTGLSVLQSEQKYEKVFFWGKIYGTTSNYYLAYGLREVDFEFPEKKFFVASDSFVFSELPELYEEDLEKLAMLEDSGALAATFVGDAGLPLEEEAPAEGEGEGEGAEEAEPKRKLTEAHRLAQAVSEIDQDTSVVPKGAYVLNDAHQVISATDFRGLSFYAAQQLSSYAHFRPATSIAKLRALASDDVQFSSDFLDPLNEDLPKGCWTMRVDPAVSFVAMRSLVWPGYSAFHIPGTGKFGGTYFGHANKNKDLAFLL